MRLWLRIPSVAISKAWRCAAGLGDNVVPAHVGEIVPLGNTYLTSVWVDVWCSRPRPRRVGQSRWLADTPFQRSLRPVLDNDSQPHTPSNPLQHRVPQTRGAWHLSPDLPQR